MTHETITWIWFGVGVAMAVAELLVPGAVLVFLGSAAMLVAGARAVGLIDTVVASFTAWFIISLGLTLSLRGIAQRIAGGQRSVQSTDEDLAAFGREVVVLSDIVAFGGEGRIRFRGTTWKARSVKGTIPVGIPARIVHRENTVWIVEPLAALPQKLKEE